MAKKKDNAFITFELQFLEEKLQEMKNYIDSRPLDKLEDRVVNDRVVATVEKQREDIFKSIEEYAKISAQVEKLRETVEEEEVSVGRGGKSMSYLERRFANKK